MDNTVTINKNKENTLEFLLSVEGASPGGELSVKLCIKTGKCDYVFKAVKDIQDKYKVIIPPMPELEKTMFPCVIEVITADGYYFEAMKGNVNVVVDAAITAQPVYAEKKPEVVVPAPHVPSVPVESNNVSVEEVADSILKQTALERTVAEMKKDVPAINKNDEKIKDILRESGFVPPAPIRKPPKMKVNF